MSRNRLDPDAVAGRDAIAGSRSWPWSGWREWRRRLPWLLLGLLVLGGAARLLLREAEPTCRVTVHPELVRYLHAHGTARARQSVSHFSPISGEAAKILELADEGSMVRAGDVIGRIDPYSVRERLRSERGELKRLESELETHRIQLALAEEGSLRDEQRSRAELAAARGRVESYQATGAPLRELELKNAAGAAEQERREQEQKVQDLLEFLEKGYASEAELEQARRAQEAAEARHREALQRLEAFRRFERQQELQDRRREVRDLEARLAEQLSSREADRRLGKARSLSLNNQIEDRRKRIQELEAQIEGCTIRAGTDGIVVHGMVHDKETGLRSVRVGDLVWSNVVVIQVTDLRQVDLVVSVPEEQMHDLQVGLEATVWMTAEPLTALEGRVRAIGTMTNRSVQVRVEILEPPGWIRPGMTGKTRVVVRRFRDAVLVPFAAVAMEGEQAYVYARGLRGPSPRAVRILGSVDEGVVVQGEIRPGMRILREAPAR